ncbi:reprolysin-like metallopeptidase, partial [Lutibacter sp.]|uniref:reprolysin-like metallopeptidase n=1 Tax=Lutibacter sp. TaxID=1925666 RepID=UPI0027372AE4
MSQKRYKYFSTFIMLIAALTAVTGQNKNDLWFKNIESNKSNVQKIERRTFPNKSHEFDLNLKALKLKLENAPKRKGEKLKSSTIVSFPNSFGKIDNYEVFEASIMDEELEKKYPTIKSYAGKSIDNPTASIRFSVSSKGFHGMIFHDGITTFIDPLTISNDSYIVYAKNELPLTEPFECKFDEINTTEKVKYVSSGNSAKAENASGGQLRTFRLAIATTGEYSQFHLTNKGILATATEAEKKAAVLLAIVDAMTRVNAIFERDLALTMILVANNTNLIFLDSATDGFSNSDSNALINESQTVINATIGSTSYDIGHTFSTGGGGLAQLNSPCTTQKARGITGSSQPIGDSYYIDYVAHEMGHQFGAHHTFNGDAGNCSGGNRNDATAVEPGSGSTIMAYSGICAPQNVQNKSDDYFHVVSIREMWANITNGNSTCGSISVTGNVAPTVVDLPNYIVPISTPFVLNAIASDANSDNLTFTWEQLNTEITTAPPVSTATGGPAFRSMSPSTSSKRFFPQLTTVLAGNLGTTWEQLPSVSRSMRFGVTVRDNFVGGGHSTSKETTVAFDGNSGPFKFTSQLTIESWDSGVSKLITWDVANTNVSPVSCNFVNILLSTDGGNTFPTVLASNVSNDGSQQIVVPNITTTSGRIKIESVDNIFYTINKGTITIQTSEFIMNFAAYEKETCAPNSVVYNFTYNTFSGFNETTTFSASNLPTGTTATFSPTTAISNNTVVTMTINSIENNDVGPHTISVTGTSATKVKSTSVALNVFSTVLTAPILTAPLNNVVNVPKPFKLSWETHVNSKSYLVEISTNNTFSTIVQSSTVINNTLNPSSLMPNTIYFWRVKGINNCGTSSYSSIFSFKTENEICFNKASVHTPIEIPDNNTSGIGSTIKITDYIVVTDVNITVNITHPWIGDLSLFLINPQGEEVLLSANNGDEGVNYTNTIFNSDNTLTAINFGIPPFTGSFSPQGDLSKFNTSNGFGDWTLKVVDGGPEDVGTINNWSIDICGIVSDDSDKDGVNNANDLCPNTPSGETVTSNGCTKFTLPFNNYVIQVISETCPGKNNGQVKITATAIQNYIATISGVATNFINNNFASLPLTPGTYTLCITVTGQSYEQCYQVVIAAGTAAKGNSSIFSNKMEIEMVQGTAPFDVFVNDKMLFQTSAPQFSVDVKHGDEVQVKTSIDCEGVFLEKVDLYQRIIAYPNPTNGN